MKIKQILSVLAVATAFMTLRPDALFPQGTAVSPSPSPAAITAHHEADCGHIARRVMAVTLSAWAGLALYLFRIDRKLARMEKERHER